jgi:hypothetical protein
MVMPRTSSTTSFLSKAARKTSLVRTNGAGVGSGSGLAALPWRQRLGARSRVTNLGILLLLSFSVLSLFLNLRLWLSSGDPRGHPPKGWASWDTFFGDTPDTLLNSLPEPAKGTENLNHLIVVVGHAIWGEYSCRVPRAWNGAEICYAFHVQPAQTLQGGYRTTIGC